METEIYLKLILLAAILITALMHPILSALVLTGVAAWRIEAIRIGDIALIQKIAGLTPPGMKALLENR